MFCAWCMEHFLYLLVEFNARSMRTKVLLFSLHAILCFQSSWGQSDHSPLNQYKRAVQWYADARFEEANQGFKTLVTRPYTDALTPYALYYQARIAFQQKQYFQSRSLLRKVMEQFGDWDSIEEVFYLYAAANHAEGFHEAGLTFGAKVQDPSILQDLESMQAVYLRPVKDLPALLKLYDFFPQNLPLITQIVQVIQGKRVPSKSELELSDRLTNQIRGQIAKPQKTKSVSLRPAPVDQIHIGVLLPFELTSVDPQSLSRRNQYVFDLYLGMKMAVDNLKKRGMKVVLHPFDLGNSAEDAQKIVDSRGLEAMHVVIGPLYPQPNDAIAPYLQKNQIPQIHPISNSEQLINMGEQVFLAQPSYETMAEKCLTFWKDMADVRTVSIYHGPARKDVVFAEIYQQTAQKMGFKVLEKKAIVDDKFTLVSQTPGHIFVVGDEQLYPKIRRGLTRQRSQAPVLATATSLSLDALTLDNPATPLYLVYPEFVDQDKSEVSEFRSRYINEVGMAPSFFSFAGFDIVSFFSRMILKKGEPIRHLLDSNSYTQGYTLSGFDYTKGKQVNKIVPIVRFNDGKWVEISR